MERFKSNEDYLWYSPRISTWTHFYPLYWWFVNFQKSYLEHVKFFLRLEGKFILLLMQWVAYIVILFISFLQYDITVWGKLLNHTVKQYLSFRKAVRIILNETSWSHSLLLFKDLYLLTLSEIFKLKLQTLVYTSTKLLAPSCCHCYFYF